MGHMQLLGAVVTRSVPDEHGLDMGRQGWENCCGKRLSMVVSR